MNNAQRNFDYDRGFTAGEAERQTLLRKIAELEASASETEENIDDIFDKTHRTLVLIGTLGVLLWFVFLVALCIKIFYMETV